MRQNPPLNRGLINILQNNNSGIPGSLERGVERAWGVRSLLSKKALDVRGRAVYIRGLHKLNCALGGLDLGPRV